MALTSSALLLAAALVVSPEVQSFGRFGYGEIGEVPGFRVNREGFVANWPSSDKFRFVEPSSRWQPLATTEFGQVVGLSEGAWKPSKLSLDLLSPGFSIYCPNGIALNVNSTLSPYLSWLSGSVAESVPTPDVKWVVVSFRDSQPPIVVGFQSGATGLVVTGESGKWRIQTTKSYSGWIRVALPLGLRGEPDNSAASLGKLVQVAALNEAVWTSKAASFQKRSIATDDLSVTAEWHFDRPGVVVPAPAVLADIAGYPIKVLSGSTDLDLPTDSGPTVVTTEQVLRIRFPVRKVPPGRALCFGADFAEPVGTVSPQDVPSIAELALLNLLAERDVRTRNTGREVLAQYLSTAPYVEEPYSRQQLPFTAEGTGLDLAAGHALLMQVLTNGDNPIPEPNSLLTSLRWRRDWGTWGYRAIQPQVGRRAAALAALAGALRPEPDARLEAGILQAGLSGARALNIWKRRRGEIPSEPPLIEPLHSLRAGLFGLQKAPADSLPFAEAIRGPLRVFGEPPITYAETLEGPLLSWPAVEAKPSVFSVMSPSALLFAPFANLAKFGIAEEAGVTQIRYVPDVAGTCETTMLLSGELNIPKAVTAPSYSEPAQ